MNLKRVATLALKEWRETTRDRLFLALAILLPVLWMVVFGYGLVLDVENIPFTILDRDRTALSRDYLYRFVDSRYFSYQGSLDHEDEADGLLERGTVRVVIVIPEKFEERLLAGFPASVQILMDGTFPMRTDIAKGYVISINQAFSQVLVVNYLVRTRGLTQQQARALIQPLQLKVRYLYNQEVESIWGLGPGLVMFSLIFSTPMLTALGVVREKERGSILNIYSSTVTRLEFLVGKLFPFVVIATCNAIVLWVLVVFLFEVPFKGNFFFFTLASIVFVVCCTAMGFLVSLLVNTQMAALIITLVLTTVPTFLFSGFITPVSSLGPGAQMQAHLFPAMYYTDMVRGVFLKGIGFEGLGVKLMILTVYTSVLLGLGFFLFTKRPKV